MRNLRPFTKYLQVTGVIAVFVGLAVLRQVLGYNKVVSSGANSSTDFLSMSASPIPSALSTPLKIFGRREEDGEDDDDFRRIVVSNKPASSSPATVVTTVPSAVPAVISTPSVSNGQYKDGTYTGQVADAYYGNVQVQLVVASGKIAKVNVLQFPGDNGTSKYINGQAMPMLQQEVIKAQNGNINAVSGASASSQAFSQSLNSALQQAI